MSRYDSVYGVLLITLVMGLMWGLGLLTFGSGCSAYRYEVPLPPAAVEHKPSGPRLLAKGDSVTARHRANSTWLSTGCCDVLYASGALLTLGPPCSTTIQDIGAWKIYDCLEGRSFGR